MKKVFFTLFCCLLASTHALAAQVTKTVTLHICNNTFYSFHLNHSLEHITVLYGNIPTSLLAEKCMDATLSAEELSHMAIDCESTTGFVTMAYDKTQETETANIQTSSALKNSDLKFLMPSTSISHINLTISL
jgi:hypothetical protein